MIPNKLKSRKFWLAILNALLVILNEGLGLGIPEEAVRSIGIVVISYIIAEGGVDIARTLKYGT